MDRYPQTPLNSVREAVSLLLKLWLPPVWNTKKSFQCWLLGLGDRSKGGTVPIGSINSHSSSFIPVTMGSLSVSRYLSKAVFPGTKGPQHVEGTYTVCRMYLSWTTNVFEDSNFIDLYSFSSSIHYKVKNWFQAMSFQRVFATMAQKSTGTPVFSLVPPLCLSLWLQHWSLC